MNFKNTKRIYKLIDFYSKIEGILQNWIYKGLLVIVLNLSASNIP
jgi:hypothetical protein